MNDTPEPVSIVCATGSTLGAAVLFTAAVLMLSWLYYIAGWVPYIRLMSIPHWLALPCAALGIASWASVIYPHCRQRVRS